MARLINFWIDGRIVLCQLLCSISRIGWQPVALRRRTERRQPVGRAAADARNGSAQWTYRLYHRQRRHQNCRNSVSHLSCHLFCVAFAAAAAAVVVVLARDYLHQGFRKKSHRTENRKKNALVSQGEEGMGGEGAEILDPSWINFCFFVCVRACCCWLI